MGSGAAEVALVRHGQATQWSRDGRHTGPNDVPLRPDDEPDPRALPVRPGRRSGPVPPSPLRRAARTDELAGQLVLGAGSPVLRHEHGSPALLSWNG